MVNLSVTLAHLFPGMDFERECVLQDDGGGPYIKAWRRAERQPTDAELKAAEPAAIAAEQAKEAQKVESDTARDEAKRAIQHLDTIIAGAPTATNAQMKTWVEQLARIAKHHILATVGR
jgi:hypothetical protein